MLTSIVRCLLTFLFLGFTLKKKVVKKLSKEIKKSPKAAQKSEKLPENVLLMSTPYCVC